MPGVAGPGDEGPDGVPVSSGIVAGEMVAIAGVHTLIKGQKVQAKIESAQ